LLIHPKVFIKWDKRSFGDDNIASEEQDVLSMLGIFFVGIIVLVVGWVLATTPSDVQPAGIAIFIFGIFIMIAGVLSILR
jgi:uncharacterized membrane protein